MIDADDAYAFRLADLGEGLDEVEVVAWHVAVGDVVERDQVLVTVQSDKSDVEMPSPVRGVFRSGPAIGARVRVGEVLATIEVSDGSDRPRPVDTPPVTSTSPAMARPPVARAAPAVRRLARELGVDLASLTPAGQRGEVTREQVLEAHRSPPSGGPTSPDAPPVTSMSPNATMPSAGSRVPLRGLRGAVARRMTESWHTIPHTAGLFEFDAVRLIELRQVLGKSSPGCADLTYVPILVKIVAAALQENPLLNSSLDEDALEIVIHADCNIGVAVGVEGGVVVPVVPRAQTKSIGEIHDEVRSLTALAREGQLRPHHMQEGTFTVNNIGAIGGGLVLPLINPPQAGIIAFGRIMEKAVVVDGQVVARPMMPVTSVSDHRIVDGAGSLRFVESLSRFIANPSLLLGSLR